jgi:hypothetical protein
MLGGMEDMYRPTGGDPEDQRGTEQFWPMTPASPAAAGPGQPVPTAGLRDHFARDRRRALRWTIGLVACLAVAVGAVLLGFSLGGQPTSAAASSPGAQAQGAALDAALNSADSPGVLAALGATPAGTTSAGTTSAGTTSAGTAPGSDQVHRCAQAVAAARADRRAGRPQAARAALRAAHCLGWRRRLFRAGLLRGIDGQVTIRTAAGLRTLAFERGTVQSVSGSTVVVRAADGTTWTWHLVSNTVVRRGGAKVPRTALSQGQPVWVGGPVASGAKDARLIVISPPGGAAGAAPAAPAPTPSASAS